MFILTPNTTSSAFILLIWICYHGHIVSIYSRVIQVQFNQSFGSMGVNFFVYNTSARSICFWCMLGVSEDVIGCFSVHAWVTLHGHQRARVQQNGVILLVERCNLDGRHFRPRWCKVRRFLHGIMLEGNTNDPNQEMKLKGELVFYLENHFGRDILVKGFNLLNPWMGVRWSPRSKK